ncbi:MAG: hypothetical protein WC641_07820 [Patescibacteria group bacterium]
MDKQTWLWLMHGIVLAGSCLAAWIEFKAAERKKKLPENDGLDRQRIVSEIVWFDFRFWMFVLISLMFAQMLGDDLAHSRYLASIADALTLIPLIFSLITRCRHLRV